MSRVRLPSSRARGFTLVEVILALGLTAMLLGLLSSGVYVVARDWNRNSDVLDAELDQALTILQLERALQGAFPHSFTNLELLSRQVYFLGDRDQLRFVSTVSPQRVPGLMAWHLASDPDLGVTLRLARAYTDDPTLRLEEQDPLVLLPGYSVEFAYLVEESEDAMTWLDAWDGTELLRLPRAIYARFVPLSDTDAELELVAPVRAIQHRSISPDQAALENLL